MADPSQPYPLPVDHISQFEQALVAHLGHPPSRIDLKLNPDGGRRQWALVQVSAVSDSEPDHGIRITLQDEYTHERKHYVLLLRTDTPPEPPQMLTSAG